MGHYILVTDEKSHPSDWLQSPETENGLYYYAISPEVVAKKDLDDYVRGRMTAGLATALISSDQRLKAFFFDMDGTLIDQETINELARTAGKLPEVASITEKAMRGEIEFSEALRLRVAMLKGLNASVFESILETMTLTNGMRELLEYLKSKGVPYYLISGGFDYFASAMAKRYGFDSHLANSLEEKGGILTGRLIGQIIDAEAKGSYVLDTSNRLQYELSTIAAVGDGANDIPMLDTAGVSAGFNARPKLFNHINIFYKDSHDFLLKILKKLPLC